MNDKDYEIVKDQDHYKVYIYGEFYCTADTFNEASVELRKAFAEKQEEETG